MFVGLPDFPLVSRDGGTETYRAPAGVPFYVCMMWACSRVAPERPHVVIVDAKGARVAEAR